MKNIFNKLLLCTVTVILFSTLGCAGSPMHTSNLSSNELKSIDNRTLCMGATPREYFIPKKHVLREVARRKLDCSKIYKYIPQAERK